MNIENTSARQRLRTTMVAASAAVLLLVAGCTTPTPEPSDAPAEGLAGVEIPADFVFATTRGVHLSVRAAEGSSSTLLVALPNGQLLYRGPILAQGLSLGVPTKDTTLKVTLQGDGASVDHDVPIEGGVAVLTL